MKKRMIFALVMLMSFTGAVFAQTPASLPYQENFSDPADNANWTLRNGGCANRWFIHALDGATKLYISNDDGATAGYDGWSTSVVVAERLFQTGVSDSTVIKFTCKVGGVGVLDFLKVFWVPEDTVYAATTFSSEATRPYYSQINYSTNCIASNAESPAHSFINCISNFTEFEATVPNVPNSRMKLVFVWVNDSGRDYLPSAIIEDVDVTESCDLHNVRISEITSTTAKLSWEGNHGDNTISRVVLKVNEGPGKVIHDATNRTDTVLTGLTPATTYCIDLGGDCYTNESGWKRLYFTTQQTPESVPYTCNFGTPGDNGWLLKNGSCENRWTIGTPASESDGKLYISSDNGATAGYDVEEPSVVVAEKLIQTGTSDSITIKYKFKVGGESRYDYLKVYWAPADTNYEASFDTPYYAEEDYYNDYLINNQRSSYDGYPDMVSESIILPNVPNSLRKLIFVWRNDHSNGTQPGAVIDDVAVFETCKVPTDLTATNITQTSAEISWNGTATGYYIMVNGGYPVYCNTPSKTLDNLEPGKEYFVQVYSHCAENNDSYRTGFYFSTKQAPQEIPYTCDFNASDNNGWLLKNGNLSNRWYVDTPADSANGELFVSGNNGNSCFYKNRNTIVVAEKLFQTGSSDSLKISFDLHVNGEEQYDFLKVLWVSADSNFEATTYEDYSSIPDFAKNNSLDNVIMSDGGYACLEFINERMEVTIENEPNTLKKLVFVWVNDNAVDNDGTPEEDNRAAIIDNLSIEGIDLPCVAPANIVANNVTATTADVCWEGTTSSYEVRLNGGTAEVVNTPSKSFTGLTAGTAYTFEVRAICSEYLQSTWRSLEFNTSSSLTDIENGVSAVVYPNPAKDKATLSLKGLTSAAKIIVSDIRGRAILSDELPAGTEAYELMLNGFESGVYNIAITCGQSVTTQKLIVE